MALTHGFLYSYLIPLPYNVVLFQHVNFSRYKKTIEENTHVIEFDFILAASFQNIKITYIVQ